MNWYTVVGIIEIGLLVLTCFVLLFSWFFNTELNAKADRFIDEEFATVAATAMITVVWAFFFGFIYIAGKPQPDIELLFNGYAFLYSLPVIMFLCSLTSKYRKKYILKL